MKRDDNHPGLASPLYADAFRARAAGDADRAWALEEAAIRGRHYTEIDVTCRGLAKLRHGDWSGWQDYDLRLSDARHRHRMGKRFMFTHEPFTRYTCDANWNWTERPTWEAELREMTILVGHEGGVGDVIWLSRYLSSLAARAKHVYWLVPLDLKRLAEAAYGSHWEENAGYVVGGGTVDVIAQEQLPAFDRYVMMFSLPAIVGEMLPPGDAYRPVVHLGSRGGATGLVWAGSPLYAENLPLYGNMDIRSMDKIALTRLLVALFESAPLGTRFLSYQRGPASGWIERDETFLRATGDWYDTYQSLASECARVVTVDTGVAHLSAAMGIPTYTMLAYDHDWRWNWGERVTAGPSIWYPSMHLVSQRSPGDWSYPIEEVVRQLKAENP